MGKLLFCAHNLKCNLIAPRENEDFISDQSVRKSSGNSVVICGLFDFICAQYGVCNKDNNNCFVVSESD